MLRKVIEGKWNTAFRRGKTHPRPLPRVGREDDLMGNWGKPPDKGFGCQSLWRVQVLGTPQTPSGTSPLRPLLSLDGEVGELEDA